MSPATRMAPAAPGRTQSPVTIVIGDSLTDPTPEAKDEFAYDPNGQRYARKTVWKDGGSTYTEEVAYIGAVEVISDDSTGSTQTVTKTRLSSNVMHVKIVGAGTETFFEYAHRDHLGSIEAVTDDNGNVLDQLAFEPFGSRKGKDWTSNISASEQDALLSLSSGHARKARGFTGHEHLDRTGFIHMNGRVFDPVLGRFLSPDPIVQAPTFSQHWNRYSYVFNTPTSFTDPSGFCPECPPREIELDPGDIDLRRDDYSRNERGGAIPPNLRDLEPKLRPFENETDYLARSWSFDSIFVSDADLYSFIEQREQLLSLISISSNIYPRYDLALIKAQFSGQVGDLDLAFACANDECPLVGGYLEQAVFLFTPLKVGGVVSKAPGRAQTRINVAAGPTRFTPLRASGKPISAGFEHVLSQHFGRVVTRNRSVFTIGPADLRTLLQSSKVVNSPVSRAGSIYYRTVDVGHTIGTSSLLRGGGRTSVLRVYTDRAGNLITAFPL